QFDDHLTNQLLVLAGVVLGFTMGQLLLGAADGVPLIVEQAPDLANGQYILTLIVAAVSPPLDGSKLTELLLPIAQHMGLHAAEVADLTDREIPLPRNWRQFSVVTGFQHMLPPSPSAFDRDGTSQHDGR